MLVEFGSLTWCSRSNFAPQPDIGLIYVHQPLQGAQHLYLEHAHLGCLPLHVYGAQQQGSHTCIYHRLLAHLEPYYHIQFSLALHILLDSHLEAYLVSSDALLRVPCSGDVAHNEWSRNWHPRLHQQVSQPHPSRLLVFCQKFSLVLDNGIMPGGLYQANHPPHPVHMDAGVVQPGHQDLWSRKS